MKNQKENQMPIDKPGDKPENKTPRQDPPDRDSGNRRVPEKDPTLNEPPQQAPTDVDIARQGRIEAGGPQSAEPQATVDAANGEQAYGVEGP